jgi:hypothetical protein
LLRLDEGAMWVAASPSTHEVAREEWPFDA